LFSALPKDFAVPVVCVQHMPPLFTKLLAERLGASSPLQFHEAQGGETLAPGHVYIAKGDHHLRVVREGNEAKLVLDRGPAENSCRPAVDVLFRSAATAFGAGTLAVVMTGMGQDGLVGSKSVREHGGHIIAQDEASSIVWGMPGFVAKAGLAEAILPLSQIGPYIARKLEQQTALVRRPQAVAARR
jgi:two-component system chemotaxis response regulator CheB